MSTEPVLTTEPAHAIWEPPPLNGHMRIGVVQSTSKPASLLGERKGMVGKRGEEDCISDGWATAS